MRRSAIVFNSPVVIFEVAMNRPSPPPLFALYVHTFRVFARGTRLFHRSAQLDHLKGTCVSNSRCRDIVSWDFYVFENISQRKNSQSTSVFDCFYTRMSCENVFDALFLEMLVPMRRYFWYSRCNKI